MDLKIIIISEVSQRKTVSYESIYMWNLEKQIQMNLFTKQTQCLQKTVLCLPKGKRGGKGKNKLGSWY